MRQTRLMRLGIGSLLGIGVLVALQPAGVMAQSPAWTTSPRSFEKGKAVKLEVETHSPSWPTGSEATIEVQVKDSYNQPTPAPRDLPVEVETRSPSGRTERQQVIIKEGETSRRVSVPVTEPGITEIRAMQRELLEGGTLIKGRPSAPPTNLRRGSWLDTPQRRLALQPSVALAQLTTPGGNGPMTLEVRYSPRRGFLADGNDAATIHVFLLNSAEGAPGDVRVRLFSSSGVLDPDPIVIKKGQDSARARLVSDQPDTVTVDYLGSQPTLPLKGEEQLKIRFKPPVTQVNLRTSPPSISLLDSSDLIVRLLDHHGAPVTTDEPRDVSFEIRAGRGVISANQVSIPAGQSEVRASFLPTWWGPVVVAASTPNLLTTTGGIDVTLPLLLLGASIVGGTVAGFIAAHVQKKSAPWRALIGLVAGVVLYWAVVFLGIDVLPRGVVVNPVSPFVLSVLGGWGGTNVFDLVAKKLRLTT